MGWQNRGPRHQPAPHCPLAKDALLAELRGLGGWRAGGSLPGENGEALAPAVAVPKSIGRATSTHENVTESLTYTLKCIIIS